MKSRYSFVAAVVVLGGLYLSSLYNYLLFHSLAEIFSIVIACGIFITAWNSRRFLQNGYLLFLGIAYLFIACLDLLHTFAYSGMPIFPGFGANLPTQLWIAARYMESLSLLSAPLLFRFRPWAGAIFIGCAAVTIFLILSIFGWKIFPACFIEGTGMTPFKKISEYVISLILLTSIGLLLRHREEFDRKVLRWLIWSIVFTIASELAFTFYVGVYGLSNLIGHYFKILSFYFIYKAIIETGLARPYDLLFKELQRSRDELEIRVQERTAELRKMNESQKIYLTMLEQTNRELEDFVYIASHDLQEPARKIQTMADRLAMIDGEPLSNNARDYLERIRGAARRMQELVLDLLRYSRVTSNPTPFVPFNLREPIEEAVGDLSAFCEDVEGHIEIDELPDMEGDKIQMRLLFQNLIANGLKYHNEKKPLVRVHDNSSPSNPLLEIHVEDNGIGFDEKYLDKIFKPFQRLHGKNSPYPGTGMGLAICRRVAERHGGSITARSKPGIGATFIVRLPRKQQQIG